MGTSPQALGAEVEGVEAASVRGAVEDSKDWLLGTPTCNSLDSLVLRSREKNDGNGLVLRTMLILAANRVTGFTHIHAQGKHCLTCVWGGGEAVGGG